MSEITLNPRRCSLEVGIMVGEVVGKVDTWKKGLVFKNAADAPIMENNVTAIMATKTKEYLLNFHLPNYIPQILLIAK